MSTLHGPEAVERDAEAPTATLREPAASPRGAAAVARLFERLDERDVTHVVPRKHRGLPETVRGDVDVFAPADEFDVLLETARDLGFESRESGTRRTALGLLAQGARNPRRAASTVLSAPRAAVAMLRGTAGHKHGYRNVKLYGHGTMLDLRNHLAYVSPWNGSRVRVDPRIEELLYERRRRMDGVVVPSPVDELAHVVAHCVFDKEGLFEPYYVERCDDLFARVAADPETDAAFRELLSLQYYGAADLVYETVAEGAYQQLRSRLWRFDDY